MDEKEKADRPSAPDKAAPAPPCGMELHVRKRIAFSGVRGRLNRRETQSARLREP